jgi:hypothetical protein
LCRTLEGRVGHSTRQDIAAIECRGDDDDRTDDANRRTFIDESMAVELTPRWLKNHEIILR